MLRQKKKYFKYMKVDVEKKKNDSISISDEYIDIWIYEGFFFFFFFQCYALIDKKFCSLKVY